MKTWIEKWLIVIGLYRPPSPHSQTGAGSSANPHGESGTRQMTYPREMRGDLLQDTEKDAEGKKGVFLPQPLPAPRNWKTSGIRTTVLEIPVNKRLFPTDILAKSRNCHQMEPKCRKDWTYLSCIQSRTRGLTEFKIAALCILQFISQIYYWTHFVVFGGDFVSGEKIKPIHKNWIKIKLQLNGFFKYQTYIFS